MSVLEQKMISFDAEDRPPPDYYSRHNLEPPKVHLSSKKTIEQAEWVKAPEFVPRLKSEERTEIQPLDPLIIPPTRIPFPPPSDRTILKPNIFPPHNRLFEPTLVPLPQPFLPLLPGQRFLGPPMSRPLLRLPMRPAYPQPNNRLMKPQFATGYSKPLSAGLPPGYSANVTSINAGIGPPIPAIVLKKKRKKKNRKQKIKLQSISPSQDQAPTDPNSHEESTSLIGDTKESSPDETSIGLNRSEPDLTKLTGQPTTEIDIDDVMNALEQNQPIISGSCPDLSEPQWEMLDEFWLAAQQSQNKKVPAEPNIIENPLNPENDYDVCSNVIFNALQDAVTTDKIRSPAVRALDKEVRQEMGLPKELDTSYIDYNDDNDEYSRENSEERMYEKLLKDSEAKQPNPACTPKSLQDEIEERRNFEKTPQMTAVVQGMNEKGFRSMVLDPNAPDDKMTRTTIEALFPATNYEDDEGQGEPMHITVNAFDDPQAALEGTYTAVPNGTTFFQNPASMAPLDRPKKVCCSIM